MFEAKYTDVAERLRFDIRNGRFGGRNIRLPSFRELAKEYNVSLVTIAKSMNHLQQENVVDIQGTRGAFIKEEISVRPRSNDIAVIHNFIGDRAGFHAIEALENYTKAQSMGMLALKANESMQYLPSLFTNLNADGFIFMHSSLTPETAEALWSAKIPFVSFNRLDLEYVSWVDYDNESGMKAALDFLLGSGCRRIASVDFKVSFGNYQQGIFDVYRKTLSAAGCFDDKLFIARDNKGELRREYSRRFLAEASRRAAGYLMELPEFPDAVVIRSLAVEEMIDECARHGIDLRKKARLVVAIEDIQDHPEDISLLLSPYCEKVKLGFDLLHKFIRTGTRGPEQISMQPIQRFISR